MLQDQLMANEKYAKMAKEAKLERMLEVARALAPKYQVSTDEKRNISIVNHDGSKYPGYDFIEKARVSVNGHIREMFIHTTSSKKTLYGVYFDFGIRRWYRRELAAL